MKILALCAFFLLSGCNGAQPDGSRLPPPTLDTRTPTPMAAPHPVPKAIIERLLDEVATNSGVARDDLILQRAEEATWGDTSLGCPQPNQGYMQRIVKGYWVVLHTGTEEYDYRIDQNGGHQRCTGSTRQAPIKYPSDT